MSLNTSGDAAAISDAMINFKSGDPDASNAMVQPIESIIDAGFQAATPSKASIDISPPAGSFRFPTSWGDSSMPDLIGAECARYWSAAIAPGAPQVCSSIVSVSNDASKIAAPIAANIRALFTGSYLTPYYYDFIDAIHREVKTIVWTVSEASSKCSSTYTVTVS